MQKITPGEPNFSCKNRKSMLYSYQLEDDGIKDNKEGDSTSMNNPSS
jgi:hypothetical protein